MSQYGNQQYGQGPQNPVQDDPSASGYGNEQQDPSQGGYGGQEDPSQRGYGGQEDPSQRGYEGQEGQNTRQNGYGQGQNWQEQEGEDQISQNRSQQMQRPKGPGAMSNKQQRANNGAMTKPRAEVNPRHAHYDQSHHNAVHHAGRIARGGFTSKHMDSAIHLGMYALGSLANTHGLAPEAPHPGDNEEESFQ